MAITEIQRSGTNQIGFTNNRRDLGQRTFKSNRSIAFRSVKIHVADHLAAESDFPKLEKKFQH